MFQPAAKLEFVRRYCSPVDGWKVFVDIDASEEGNTGGERRTTEARDRQKRMQLDTNRVRFEFGKLGVQVGGNRRAWFAANSLPTVVGDRDIVAFHFQSKLILVAEVEGESSGQPEQKLYKALGQLVIAAGEKMPPGWHRRLVLVVFGEKIAVHLARAQKLAELGVSGLCLAHDQGNDRWSFGGPI